MPPLGDAMATVAVRASSRGRKVRARRNSFHEAMKTRMAVVTIPGRGKRRDEARQDAGSSQAVDQPASSIAGGIVRKKATRKNTGKIEGRVGDDERDGIVGQAEGAHDFVEREEKGNGGKKDTAMRRAATAPRRGPEPGQAIGGRGGNRQAAGMWSRRQ